jgi:hypothetical protein
LICWPMRGASMESATRINVIVSINANNT